MDLAYEGPVINNHITTLENELKVLIGELEEVKSGKREQVISFEISEKQAIIVSYAKTGCRP
jgi:hypothetical protein